MSCLVAAHIKKRAACSLEEKKDYKSIVMPMCSFGCDYLYERGYIAVSDGKIIDLKKKANNTDNSPLSVADCW